LDGIQSGREIVTQDTRNMKPSRKPVRTPKPYKVLWLGVSKKTVNPPKGARLMGYPSERPNTGVESDLHVRTAVFGAGPGKPGAALVVIDNLYAPASLVAEVRRTVARQLPGLKAAAIMIAATHTHSAPSLQPYYSANPREGLIHPDPSYRRKLIQTMVAPILDAWKKRRPVTARFGAGRAKLGHNRRVLVHGYARNIWQDPHGKHTGYFNPEIPFITFHEAETGNIHAVLAGYGCHPVTLGPGNLKACADYPGYFVHALEKATGAEVAIHIMTGAADINPLRCLRDRTYHAKIMGKALARAVIQELPRSRPIPLKPATSRTVPLRFRVRSNVGRWADAQILGRVSKDFIQTEVQTINLGGLTLVSAPGELFSEIATRVRKSSPAKNTLVVEHANDAVGYIFTDAAAFEGGYEVCRASISESMERPYYSAALQSLRRS
jgi:hypothetical protein